MGRHRQPKGHQTMLSKEISNEEMADAQFKAAIIHLRQQKYEAAAMDLKAAIKLHPFKPDYHYYLCDALLRTNDKVGAQKAIDKAIELLPENIEYRTLKETSGLG